MTSLLNHDRDNYCDNVDHNYFQIIRSLREISDILRVHLPHILTISIDANI